MRRNIAIALIGAVIVAFGVAFWVAKQNGPSTEHASQSASHEIVPSARAPAGATPAEVRHDPAPAPAVPAIVVAPRVVNDATPVKVGVILSHYTATGPSWMGNAQGFKWAGKSFREGLVSDGLDLYPVVEPGTADASEITEFRDKYFVGKTPIDCTDDERMRESSTSSSRRPSTTRRRRCCWPSKNSCATRARGSSSAPGSAR